MGLMSCCEGGVVKFFQDIKIQAHAFQGFVALAATITLMLLLFLPNFATVGGHDRAFGNLWCGENTIASQADIDLWDCSMETRMVKVFLPLAAIFQLFVLTQAYSIYTWHKTIDPQTTITGEDRFFLHTPTIYVGLSLLSTLISGCMYIIHHSDMFYIIGDTKTPLHSYKDGTFLALWSITVGLQIAQGMGWGIFASLANTGMQTYAAVQKQVKSTFGINPKSSNIVQANPAFSP